MQKSFCSLAKPIVLHCKFKIHMNDVIFNCQFERGDAGDVVEGGGQCAVEGANHVEEGLSVVAVVSVVSNVARLMEGFVADVVNVSAMIKGWRVRVAYEDVSKRAM